jgi:hypothetical protein
VKAKAYRGHDADLMAFRTDRIGGETVRESCREKRSHDAQGR